MKKSLYILDGTRFLFLKARKIGGHKEKITSHKEGDSMKTKYTKKLFFLFGNDINTA